MAGSSPATTEQKSQSKGRLLRHRTQSMFSIAGTIRCGLSG
jgi:hypothetical protein